MKFPWDEGALCFYHFNILPRRFDSYRKIRHIFPHIIFFCRSHIIVIFIDTVGHTIITCRRILRRCRRFFATSLIIYCRRHYAALLRH
jgi:hypothetical protein